MTREIRRLPTKVQHLGEGSAFVALILVFHWPTSLHPKDVSLFSSSELYDVFPHPQFAGQEQGPIRNTRPGTCSMWLLASCKRRQLYAAGT